MKESENTKKHEDQLRKKNQIFNDKIKNKSNL
jgi:hypothetical protein